MYTINNIEYCDLLILSTVMNAIIYGYLYMQKSRQSHSTKLFRWLVLSITVVGVLETFAWIAAVPGNAAYRPLHYISNVLFFTFNITPAALGLFYLDYITSISKEKNIRKLFFYLTPVYLSIVFIVVNFVADGFLFSVDASNGYHRGIAPYIENGFTFLFALVIVIGFFRNKQMINGRTTQVILTLTLLPVVGMILQMLFQGLSWSIPAYTIGVFVTFLLMEKNELLKDPLTLLNSRTQMEARLHFKLKSQEPFTAIMIDVDNFKGINDIYGHTVGDEVLKDVAKVLMANANYEDFVCRFGGDEFFVILESIRDIGDSYIQRIDQTLSHYSVGKPFTTALSYGLVYVNDTGKYELDELLQLTDQYMYKDKTRRKF